MWLRADYLAPRRTIHSQVRATKATKPHHICTVTPKSVTGCIINVRN
jgi:hypothetical protein